MSRNMNIILRRINQSYNDLRSKSEGWLKKACKVDPVVDWRANIVVELVNCRDGTMQCNLEKDDINTILTYLCTE